MVFSISKKDVIWNYIAQFFNIGAGLIVLPVVLHFLSPEEVGMNYLMLSLSSLGALADFGFSSQFGRNITYVFSGVQELKREGVEVTISENINYHLLSVVIATAKSIYWKISIGVLLTMLSFGTLYMYNVTEGFRTVNNSFIIWLLFSISTYFNMYFMYYNSLLTGAAMIMESKQALILNKITNITISFILLFCGMGLISVVLANLIAPFVGRWYSYIKFYRDEIKNELDKEHPKKNEIKETFFILWYNAKKLGINFLGAYGIQQSGTFIIGMFLPLAEVASYGLMCQLFTILTVMGNGIFTSFIPLFNKERVENNITKLIKDFAFSSFFFFFVFIVFGFCVILLGNPILRLIGSGTMLPILSVSFIYFVHMLLENFHSICASLIVTDNKVPFVKASIISGVLIILLNVLSLKYTALGLLGVVLGQLIVQSLYNHWKWPMYVFKDLKINFIQLISIGAYEMCSYSKKFINR